MFVKRCLYFVNDKIITGATGFKPNNKVKAIIAASAVQLTLGLDTWKLDYFDTIIIHPGDFDNKATGLKFRGETNLGGYIQLSWQSFIAGYKIGDDNVNLGLHEFSHALRFNPVRGFDQDYFIEHYFNAWLASATEPYNDLREGRESIFRKYGGTNINEFMSVCIEHFFESPQQIKDHYPFLYYSTAILLNQYKINGVTEVGVRQKLFEEKNKLMSMQQDFRINTKWTKTNSFNISLVVIAIWLYTCLAAGFTSGAALVLLCIIGAIYLRFDFYYTRSMLYKKRFILQKGFFLFRNRRKVDVTFSQLISLRLHDFGTENVECDVVYYDETENAFYSESIPTGKKFGPTFLNQVLANKIAVFKS